MVACRVAVQFSENLLRQHLAQLYAHLVKAGVTYQSVTDQLRDEASAPVNAPNSSLNEGFVLVESDKSP